MTQELHAADRLIVALDLPSVKEAEALVRQLDGIVSFFKIGLRLHLAEGLNKFIDDLIASGKKVFVDFKYNDVEETVQNAVAQAAQRGITFITVHGNGKTIRAAKRGRGDRELPRIFIVTVLTSLDADDILDLGFPCALQDLVMHRARQALKDGADGVIASGQEGLLIREMARDRLLIVSPGIRPGDTSTDDHRRPATPTEAIEAGADFLVVGRPIYRAKDPRQAAEAIIAEMQAAIDRRAG
jgi:orotidine-5'-phosphate decarboxylase